MTAEHDSPFYDLGYTTPEEGAELKADRALKASEKIVSSTVARHSQRRSRPPIGEEGHLLNVDDEPTPITPAEAEAQRNGVWAQREQAIYDDLYRRWQAALDNSDTVEAANLQAQMIKRDARQIKLGRPLIIPTVYSE